MLAGLCNVWPWVRRHFPANGAPYELFDLAVMVAVLPVLWYILGNPTNASVEVMGWLLNDTARQVGAGVVSLSGAIGVMCAYRGQVQWGAALIAGFCFMWSAFLVVGLVVHPVWAPAGSAILFGYLCRRACVVAVEEARRNPA